MNTDKDKHFIEGRIRYLLENKWNDNIGIDLINTQSNEDLIESLKSKLLHEFMPCNKIFIKEELKFSKQDNDLVNSNSEIIKSLEKEIEFQQQELVSKINL